MDTNRKLDTLKGIAKEIRLELESYKKKKAFFNLLLEDTEEISQKAGHFERMNLKIDYWEQA